MFSDNSRYAQLGQADLTTQDGRQVKVVKLRRLPTVVGVVTSLAPGQRLDIIAGQQYGDPTWFWHVADANSLLEARDLTIGMPKEITVPKT